MVEQKCNLNCCKATFCPLKPAWARSIHTTQSLQAGPTKNDKQCDFQLIIGDPGSMDFEKITPGLLYTLLSRATTIGTLEGKRNDSAIYFIGSNMSEQRMISLSKNNDGTKSKQILKRELWVQYLKDRQKQWKENNQHYFDDCDIQKFKSRFNQTDNLDLETTIQKCINKLYTNPNKKQTTTPQLNKWIRHNKKKVEAMETKRQNKRIKQMKDTTKYSCDSDEELMYNATTTEYQKRPIDIDGTYNHYIPMVVRKYPTTVTDVRANGSCGYYVIQKGLQAYGIHFEDDMNNFRRTIYEYLFCNDVEDIYASNIHVNTKRQIMNRIWDENIDFNDKCENEHYFETGTIMPIVSKMFEINVICYGVETENIMTTACGKKDNRQTFMFQGGHFDPQEIWESSQYNRSIGMLNVNNIHYMYLDLNIENNRELFSAIN